MYTQYMYFSLGKFMVGNIHVKIILGKKFSPSQATDENTITLQTFMPLFFNYVRIYMYIYPLKPLITTCIGYLFFL